MKKIHPTCPITTFMLSMFICYFITACTKDKEKGTTTILNPPKQISIATVKDLSTEQLVKIKDSGVIRGVVISDAGQKNIDNTRTLFLQEGTGKEGIMVMLKTDHSYLVNDSLEINIFGQTLTRQNGTATLQDLPNDMVKKLGIGKVTPRETTVSELQANKAEWEGSLIRIRACELISENGNYSATMKIRDGQSSMSSSIFQDAKFNGTALPGDVRSVVGIVRLNGNEVLLAPRNASEILPLTYTTDDFTTWKNTTWSSNLAMQEFALHTAFANWQGNPKDGAIKQLANAADVGFTKAGKIYPYLPKDSIASSLKLYPGDKLTLKGLKVLKVTFAASRVEGEVRFLEQSVGNQEIALSVLPFNAGTDQARIGVQIPIESTGALIPGKLVTPAGFDDYYPLLSTTPAIKETGKFYTATFFIPSTAEDLKAMGITSGKVQQWLASPRFSIVNLSSRKTPGITSTNRDRYIPILLDKVEMGF